MCVPGEGQLLSVRVLELVDGGRVRDASGFTASFKQSGNPTILRLKDEDTHLGLRGHSLNTWLQPPKELRLHINGNAVAAASPLDAEFAKLEDIKHQMALLHAVMRQQERTIVHMLKKDFKHCDGFQCMLQTAMQKAPDFAHLITDHFSHEKVKPTKNVQFEEIAFTETLALSASPKDGRPDKENPAPPTPPPFDGGHRPHPPFEGEQPHPAFKGDYPHPPSWAGEYPPPSPHEGPPEHHGEHPPPPLHQGEHPPPPHGDHPPYHKDGPQGPPGRHHHGRPSFFQRLRYHRFRIVKASLALLAGMFLTSLLFKAMRTCLPCLKDPRRRADRASRREERRTRCQYRRAAHRYRLQSWWAAHNPRRASAAGTADYDEKRALILAKEGVLENVMQHEIRNLQAAAELEEGRARFYNGPSAPQELQGASSSGLRRQQSYAASDYSAPPPKYEAELDDEMIPVNGFGYTPSNADETPESSVVDFTSPRMSCETLQTNTTKSERERLE